ncbi:hypothetical protein PsorP6_005842 [Peronosclerospora sorghi]|uniref:Uncharacterized protein n=1 Tax=Peronosclerospora sorghi TaxID=230839 RepID=A0ACC0W6E9_9STRA|nr:hypothetical protein PsorP6_005842 [Peronosclerospora sorghi]
MKDWNKTVSSWVHDDHDMIPASHCSQREASNATQAEGKCASNSTVSSIPLLISEQSALELMGHAQLESKCTQLEAEDNHV